MSDQDQRFQHRWNFRRTENDFDSSSDDDHSKPNSASDPKFCEENVQETMHSPTSIPRGEKRNNSSFEEPNRKPNQSGKTRERKARSRGDKKTTSNHEPLDAALTDLRGYMESLVEEITIAREGLLAWMTNEMISSSKGDIISSKPSGPRKGQSLNTKRRKTPRNNPSKSRRKSGTITQNQTNEEVVPQKEGENVVIDAEPAEKTEAKPVKKTQKQKGKASRLSTKKQKTDGTEADEQIDKTIAASTDNCVTLPAVLPQKQVTTSERNPLENENGREAVKRNALNSGVNLSSQHLKFDPSAQQKDGVLAQNGLRNVSDFGQNTRPTIGNGNGNGNGFPFPLAPQGSNCGIGMPNISSQFGQQYLSQSNMMSGMFGEPLLFPNGNHASMESYGFLNQPLKFNGQQSGVMSLQCPDIRRGAFNQGNATSQ